MICDKILLYKINILICIMYCILNAYLLLGVRCNSVVRAFAHGAIGFLIDPSWWTH